MERIRTTWLRRVLCGLLVSAGGAAWSDSPRAIEGGERVSVSFAMLTTPAQAATSRRHVLSQDLAVGQSMVGDAMRGQAFSFAVGGGRDGCGSQTLIGTAESQIGEHPLSWSAEAKVLEASTERLALAVSWKRFVRGPDGAPVEAASESISRVVLREGERVLLDFARPAGSGCTRSAALEVSAELKEPPSSAARQIGYDLWLVHEDGRGRHTERAQLTGRQGEQMQWAFPTQRLAAAAAPSGDTLLVAVSGRVRGRLRGDGGIELSLQTERRLSYVAADGSSDGGVSDGGEKTVRLKPESTIWIGLPAPAEGPASGDPRVPRMMKDFAGHEFALVVKAKTL